MNNKLIYTCTYCDELYCGECSTNKDWKNYCSKECEDLHRIDKEKEIEKLKEYLKQRKEKDSKKKFKNLLV